MKQHDKLKLLTGEGDPRSSPTRGPLAAALCCGLKLYGEKPFCDYIEEINGEPVRRHLWTFDGKSETTFKPAFKEETIEFNEFARRFQSDEWCAANPHHPIAHMRAMWDQLAYIHAALKPLKPALKVTKGRNWVLIPHDCPEQTKKEWLAKLDKSPA